MTTPPSAGYVCLLSATWLSSLGDGIRKVAIPLLAAGLTTSPTLVAGVTVAGQLPWLLFGLVAGGVIDRVDRRRLVATVDLARMTLLVALLIALATGGANLVLLYVIAFACGVGETVRDTAATTMVPKLVPSAKLDRANGHLVNAEISGNELIGPSIGGYLFGAAVALPFAVNGGALAIAAALVIALPDVFRRSTAEAGARVKTTLVREIREGVRWLARHPKLRAVAVMGALFALVDGAWFAILVLYAQQILSMSADGFGLLIAVGGVGGLVGAFIAGRLTRLTGHGTTLLATLVAAAACQAAMGLTSSVIVAGAALTGSSAAFAVWNVVSLTLRQRLSPDELQGRVAGAYRTLLMGAEPVGALVGGVAATLLGLRAPMLLGVPILLVTVVFGYRAMTAPDVDPA